MALCDSLGWLPNWWSEEREGNYPDVKKKMLVNTVFKVKLFLPGNEISFTFYFSSDPKFPNCLTK